MAAAEDLIRQRLDLRPASSSPELRLYLAHRSSRLGDLLDALAPEGAPAPYWAFEWGGGGALVKYLAAHPGTVRGKRIVDLGAGSGIVGLAAARHGAVSVHAIDPNPLSAIATTLNAEANRLSVTTQTGDDLGGPPPDADMILAGDVFYDAGLAARMLPYLARCAAAGIDVLVGDPFRKPLPLDRLEEIARYDVRDYGAAASVEAGVFRIAR